MSKILSEYQVWLLYWSQDASQGDMRYVYRTRDAAIEAVTSFLGWKPSDYEDRVEKIGSGIEELKWDAPHEQGQRESQRTALLMRKTFDRRRATAGPQAVPGDISNTTEVFIVGERETGLRQSRLRDSGSMVMWEKAEMVAVVFQYEERAKAECHAMCRFGEWQLRSGPSHVSFCEPCPFFQ
ncbi:MAG: hypothetical protein Q9174_005014 [Haloplaca sp. 1 TL-2023]